MNLIDNSPNSVGEMTKQVLNTKDATPSPTETRLVISSVNMKNDIATKYTTAAKMMGM